MPTCCFVVSCGWFYVLILLIGFLNVFDWLFINGKVRVTYGVWSMIEIGNLYNYVSQISSFLIRFVGWILLKTQSRHIWFRMWSGMSGLKISPSCWKPSSLTHLAIRLSSFRLFLRFSSPGSWIQFHKSLPLVSYHEFLQVIGLLMMKMIIINCNFLEA